MQKLSQYWNNLPLGVKLTGTIILLMITLMLIVTLLTIQRQQASLRLELEQQAELLLDVFTVTGSDSLYTFNTNRLDDLLEPLGAESGVLSHGRFYDSDGRIIADAFSEEVAFSINADPYGQQLLTRPETVFDWQADQLLAGRSIQAGRQTLGAVSVGLPTAPLNAKIATARNQGLLVAFIVVVLGVSVSVYFSRSITGSLGKLIEATQKIAAGDLSQSITVSGSSREFAALADSFNAMVAQLQATVQSLEERSRVLAASNQVARSLATTLDPNLLLTDIVGQIQSAFGYYQVQIYQLDSNSRELVIVAGTGPAGTDMVSKRYRFDIATSLSLVVQAARNKHLLRVGDMRQLQGWQPHPQLPNTLSEIAVPIIIDDEVIGVLDVQADSVNGLGERDEAVLQPLANQLSTAIRNAWQFTQMQEAVEKAQLLQTRYIEQAWDIQRIATRYQEHQALYSRQEGEVLSEAAIAAARRQLKEQQTLTILPVDNQNDQNKGGQLVAPLQLDTAQIGTLQLYKNDPSEMWSDSELVIINSVLDQIIQTAENLRLFDETRERAGREATIREVTDKLRAAPNIDSLLETAARELGSRLEVRHTVLELGIETTPDDSSNGQSTDAASN